MGLGVHAILALLVLDLEVGGGTGEVTLLWCAGIGWRIFIKLIVRIVILNWLSKRTV